MTHPLPLLDVRNVSKRYATPKAMVTAIDDVSFTATLGEIVSVVGTSGCGKSTLLGMIAGLDLPTTGTLALNAVPITGPGTDRGMVFQRDCLFPWLTVRGNVGFAFGLSANARLPGAVADRVDALIEQVGLASMADAYPSALSGGMRQRVAIARALVTRPQLLLMDEPFGALDAQTREQMQTLLLDIAREHRMTVLFVTHDVEEAVYLGDRVIVMRANPGHIVATVPISLDRGREPGVKLTAPFAEYRRHLLSLLHTPSPATSADTVPFNPQRKVTTQ